MIREPPGQHERYSVRQCRAGLCAVGIGIALYGIGSGKIERERDRAVFKGALCRSGERGGPLCPHAALGKVVVCIGNALGTLRLNIVVEDQDLFRNAEIDVVFIAVGRGIVPGGIHEIPLTLYLHGIPGVVAARYAHDRDTRGLQQQQVGLAVAVADAGAAQQHAVRPVYAVGQVIAGVVNQPVVQPERGFIVPAYALGAALGHKRVDLLRDGGIGGGAGRVGQAAVGLFAGRPIPDPDLQRIRAAGNELIAQGVVLTEALAVGDGGHVEIEVGGNQRDIILEISGAAGRVHGPDGGLHEVLPADRHGDFHRVIAIIDGQIHDLPLPEAAVQIRHVDPELIRAVIRKGIGEAVRAALLTGIAVIDRIAVLHLGKDDLERIRIVAAAAADRRDPGDALEITAAHGDRNPKPALGICPVAVVIYGVIGQKEAGGGFRHRDRGTIVLRQSVWQDGKLERRGRLGKGGGADGQQQRRDQKKTQVLFHSITHIKKWKVKSGK